MSIYIYLFISLVFFSFSLLFLFFFPFFFFFLCFCILPLPLEFPALSPISLLSSLTRQLPPPCPLNSLFQKHPELPETLSLFPLAGGMTIEPEFPLIQLPSPTLPLPDFSHLPLGFTVSLTELRRLLPPYPQSPLSRSSLEFPALRALSRDPSHSPETPSLSLLTPRSRSTQNHAAVLPLLRNSPSPALKFSPPTRTLEIPLSLPRSPPSDFPLGLSPNGTFTPYPGSVPSTHSPSSHPKLSRALTRSLPRFTALTLSLPPDSAASASSCSLIRAHSPSPLQCTLRPLGFPPAPDLLSLSLQNSLIHELSLSQPPSELHTPLLTRTSL